MGYKYLVTIFTPTYNRARLLKRLYESLKEQSDKDFEWVIVDDGSKDNTKEVVEDFIKEDIIPIKYLKKENEGKHIAINLGCDMAEGELFFIVDSDDYIPKDSIEQVKKDWEKYRENKSIAGLVYLKAWENGNLMGRKFEKDEFISNHVKLHCQNRDHSARPLRSGRRRRQNGSPAGGQGRRFSTRRERAWNERNLWRCWTGR